MSSTSLRMAVAALLTCVLSECAQSQTPGTPVNRDVPASRILAILQTPQTVTEPPRLAILSSKFELVRRPQELPPSTMVVVDCGDSIAAIHPAGRIWRSQHDDTWKEVLSCKNKDCLLRLTSATFSPKTNSIYIACGHKDGCIYRFSRSDQSLAKFIDLSGEFIGAIASDDASSALIAIYVPRRAGDEYGLVSFDLNGKELNRVEYRDKELGSLLRSQPASITSALTMVSTGDSYLLMAIDDDEIPKRMKINCYRHSATNLAFAGRQTVTVELQR